MLPGAVVDSIRAMRPPSILNEDDDVAWGLTLDGNFSMSSAYDAVGRFEDHPNKQILRMIWKWNGPQRIRAFLWKLCHEALLTNVARNRRGMASSATCPICNIQDETLLHVFRDCALIKEAWNHFVSAADLKFYNTTNVHDWLFDNLANNSKTQDNCWNITFAVMLDKIWWRRNDSIFNNSLLTIDNLIYKVKHGVAAIQISMQNQRLLDGNSDSNNHDIHVWWLAPKEGEVALNCDGSVTNAGTQAACGGVLRDHYGKFIFGYAMNIGSCSIVEAELWGIYHGLYIAWHRGYRKIQVYSDSNTAVGYLQRGCSPLHPCNSILSAINNIHHNEGVISWTHVLRESNQVADALAKYGLSLFDQGRIFEVQPPFISNALLADATCTWFPRGF